MSFHPGHASRRSGLAALALVAFGLWSCTATRRAEIHSTGGLRETAALVEELKAFAKTLGIEPTEALTRTSERGTPLSMLWLWMQREGTLAVSAPVDIRIAIGFSSLKEALRLEQVYRVDGYSVYYRQGNEFADPRSVATVSFAEEPMVRRAEVILHEDLHGDQNFALPWEIEEAVITPLGALAAVRFFGQRGDVETAAKAQAALGEFRKLSRELNALAAEAETVFKTESPERGKEKILELMSIYPVYQRRFERQIRGQHAFTVLEAKLSHDLAYYRDFDAIAALSEKAPDLRTLIQDLKQLPRDVTVERLEKYLRALSFKYSAPRR